MSIWKKAAPITVAALAVTVSATVLALPTVGDEAPNGKVEDADGKTLETKSFKGKPILILYEDKDSSKQNETLKKELGQLAKGDKYKTKVALAAVADLTSYDFWPVKGFVKDAIKEESKKVGTTIYCDWTGSFRKTFKLTKGKSNVILVGKDGKILFAGEGSLSEADRKKLLGMLKSEVGDSGATTSPLVTW